MQEKQEQKQTVEIFCTAVLLYFVPLELVHKAAPVNLSGPTPDCVVKPKNDFIPSMQSTKQRLAVGCSSG